MAAETKTSSIVHLNGSNYSTWKIQCHMALVKNGLWLYSPQTEVEKYAKFVAQRKSSGYSCVIGGTVSVILLERCSRPCDCVWNKLAAQFQ